MHGWQVLPCSLTCASSVYPPAMLCGRINHTCVRWEERLEGAVNTLLYQSAVYQMTCWYHTSICYLYLSRTPLIDADAHCASIRINTVFFHTLKWFHLCVLSTFMTLIKSYIYLLRKNMTELGTNLYFFNFSLNMLKRVKYTSCIATDGTLYIFSILVCRKWNIPLALLLHVLVALDGLWGLQTSSVTVFGRRRLSPTRYVSQDILKNITW